MARFLQEPVLVPEDTLDNAQQHVDLGVGDSSVWNQVIGLLIKAKRLEQELNKLRAEHQAFVQDANERIRALEISQFH